MRAMDVMSRPVYTARPDDPVEQAAALITARKITSLPVLDSAGDLVGMVSESDLLPRQGRAERPVVVADVMTEDVVVAAPAEDLAEVAKAMLDHDERCVPVLEGPELVGVVSRRDILGSLVRTEDVVCTELQVRLDEYAGGQRRWVATVTDGAAVVSGVFDDDVQEAVVGVLARTVPGVASVQLRPPR
jgi:CBS domain-containing protein